MMTGLEIAPSKMVARATNVQSEAGHLSLHLWTINGERVEVPIEHDQQEDNPSLLRYLGVHVEPDLSWRGQYEKLRVKTENLTRILSTSRASTSIKWYAMAICGYTALTYPAKYAPWALHEYENHFRPLDRTMRQLTNCSRTLPAQLMFGSTKYGSLGYTNIVDKIQHEKYKMLQSAQETGGPSKTAVQQMMMRLRKISASQQQLDHLYYLVTLMRKTFAKRRAGPVV
jgi:hypothetical protein